MKTNLWSKWTVNCALGELSGIAIAGAIAYVVNASVGEPHTLPMKLLVLASMLVAGAIEGTFLSFFQWRVLVQKFAAVPRREWWFYTTLVAVLGWFLGMLPSLFFIPDQPLPDGGQAGVDLDQPLLFVLLSVGGGLFVGALFGLFQWFSLRKYAQKAGRWILANALGWGLGLGWIFLCASLPTAESPVIFNILVGAAGGILAGLSVGAVTGAFLVRMENRL